MDHGHALLDFESFGFGGCLVVVVSKEPYLHGGTPVNPDGVDLDAGGGQGHDDNGPAPQHPGRHGYTLGVVSGRTSHHTPFELLSRQMSHFVVGSTQLEGKDGLCILTLEQNGVFQMLCVYGSNARNISCVSTQERDTPITQSIFGYLLHSDSWRVGGLFRCMLRRHGH